MHVGLHPLAWSDAGRLLFAVTAKGTRNILLCLPMYTSCISNFVRWLVVMQVSRIPYY